MKKFGSLFVLVFFVFNFSSISAQDFAWANKVGGPSTDVANSIAVDNTGNVYTVGTFIGTSDFDPGPNTFNLTSNGGSDIFITKFDKKGDFVWAYKIGGSSNDIGRYIHIDQYGDILLTGSFVGNVDFNPGNSTNTLSSNGSDDIFILKLKENGNFVWVRNKGGSSSDEGVSLVTDDLGNIYTTGWYSGSADFDPSISTYILVGSGVSAFVSKLDSSGAFIWAKPISGNSNNYGYSLSVGKSGNIYAVGRFTGTTDFDPNTSSYFLSSNGMSDIYIMKLSNSGSFMWAKSIGANWNDFAFSTVLDKYENILTTGYYNSPVDFDPGNGTHYLSPVSMAESYILKLDSSGNFVWAKSIGGLSNDQGNSIAVDDSGNVYTAGKFRENVDFDPSSSSTHILSSSSNSGDAFILKLDSNGNFVWAHGFGNTLNDYCQAIILDKHSNVYFSGVFNLTVDFNSDPNVTYNLTSTGSNLVYDAFICKYLQCSHTSSVISAIACDSYTSPSGKYVWTSNGTYYDTIMNSQGCDSNLVIGLQVNQHSNNVIFRSTCYSYTSPSGKYTWNTSGTYLDTILNSTGCDSSLIIGLIINPRTSNTINETVCNYNSYTSPSGKYNWTTSGTYMDTIPNGNGCDSVMTINLQFGLQQSITLNENACNSFTSPSGKYNWTNSGTYHDTIAMRNGCDTNYVINLTINTVDTAVSNNAMTLTSNAIGAIYQWVDCNNNYSPLSGKTHQSYTATTNGSFAVIITQNGCIDTSACHVVISTALINQSKKEVETTIFPNPTNGFVNIKAENALEIKILNINGQVVYKSLMQNTIEKIDISSLSNGIYFVQIINIDKSIGTKKLVISK